MNMKTEHLINYTNSKAEHLLEEMNKTSEWKECAKKIQTIIDNYKLIIEQISAV
jgi:hypothetical protein